MTVFERAWRGGKNDWRLHLLSIFSVAVAFVCLASALLVVVNVDGLRDRWAKAGRATVFLAAGADEAQVKQLERALAQRQGVTSVRYVSPEDARQDIVGSGKDEVLAQLPAEAFPASLEVRLDAAVDRSTLGSLAGQLSSLPAVESVETYEAWTDRLASLLAGGVTASLLLAFVVLGAVVSVVASTIRLALQRRSREVEVLKLVGATDAYVRRPFVIEGAAQGGIGAVVAIALLAVVYGIVRSRFDGELTTLVGLTPTFLPWTMTVMMVVLGGLLGAMAAYGSLRKLLVV